MMVAERKILHVDMDSYFASIEELDNPDFKGKPVIVGSDPKGGEGRGVVSTCNYIARKYGVHSAQPISQAYRLCSHAIFVPPRMNRYKTITKTINTILESFSPVIENVGIDESYLDCSGTEQLFGSSTQLGQKIKNEIFAQTGLKASIGIAPNKYISKIASDLNKPDGLAICAPNQEKKFLAPLPIERLWGAGKTTIGILKSNQIFSIGELAQKSEDEILALIGKRARQLWKLANGIDDRELSNTHERKSISEERTYEYDLCDEKQILNTIGIIAENLGFALRKESFHFKTLQLKIRLTGFRTYTRSKTLTDFSNTTSSIRKMAIHLYKEFNTTEKIRLIGISLQNLQKDKFVIKQLQLFEEDTTRLYNENHTKRDKVYDLLKTRYLKSLNTGSTLKNLDIKNNLSGTKMY